MKLGLEKAWKEFFVDFSFPYGFYEPQEYAAWLKEANLKPERVELIPKEMKLSGVQGLEGWIRTTWLPYTERLPVKRRDEFIKEIVDRYLARHPMSDEGIVNLKMMRLEVEAAKTC